MTPFVEVDGLTFGYRRGADIVSEFTSAFCGGLVSGVLGPSGSGKSTLLRLIAGLESPRQGDIRFSHPAPVISFVTQDPVIFEHYSRAENARYRQFRGSAKDRFSPEVFDQLLTTLQLGGGLLNQGRPFEPMSGGQRQRLVLLRELSIRPDLLLLDEPCTGLDAALKQRFLVSLRRVLETLNVRCIYATHHFEELQIVSDEVIYIRSAIGDGQVRPAVSVRDFVDRPPSPDAALAVVGPIGAALKVTGSDGYLRPASPSQLSSDVLVFEPGALRLADEGIPCDVVGASAAFAIATVFGQSLVVQRQSASTSAAAIRCSGAAYWFDGSSCRGRSHFETEWVNGEWMLVHSRTS